MFIKINLAQFIESERQYRRLDDRLWRLKGELNIWQRRLGPDKTPPSKLILPRDPERDEEILDIVIALEERIKILTAERDAVSITIAGEGDENESQ